MEEQSDARQVEWGPLIGGIIVGWILCWVLFGLTVLMLYVNLGDARQNLQITLGITALLVVPIVLGLVLLHRRRRGQVVAGTLLGLTIGAIVGAGVCTTTVVSGML